jgi:hypothetical protein
MAQSIGGLAIKRDFFTDELRGDHFPSWDVLYIHRYLKGA